MIFSDICSETWRQGSMTFPLCVHFCIECKELTINNINIKKKALQVHSCNKSLLNSQNVCRGIHWCLWACYPGSREKGKEKNEIVWACIWRSQGRLGWSQDFGNWKLHQIRGIQLSLVLQTLDSQIFAITKGANLYLLFN